MKKTQNSPKDTKTICHVKTNLLILYNPPEYVKELDKLILKFTQNSKYTGIAVSLGNKDVVRDRVIYMIKIVF